MTRMVVMRQVLLAGFACSAMCAFAGDPVERIVWGEVVEVEPISSKLQVQSPAQCRQGKPVAGSLYATLQWDLRAECIQRNSTRTIGYRVSYRWGGRTYVRDMVKDPGRRVPLLVRIDAIESNR